MSMQQTIEQPVDNQRRLRVSWLTVAAFAVAISFVDGFWVTSLQGAVGSLERSRPPLQRWLRDSTLMLPLYVGAVWVALLLTRRWVGRSRRSLTRIATAMVLIIAICSALAIAEVANSSAYDYHLQTQHLELVEELNHAHSVELPTQPAADAGSDSCLGLCAAKRSTLRLHVRAVTYSSVALLLTNVVLVAWLFALGGDRLWKRSRVVAPPERISS